MKSASQQHEDAVLMATARTARYIGSLPGAPTPDWAKQLAQILLKNDTAGAIHVSVAALGKSALSFECQGFALGPDAPTEPDSKRQLTRLARAAAGVVMGGIVGGIVGETVEGLSIPSGPVVWTIGDLLAMHQTPPHRHGFLRKRAALLMGFVPLGSCCDDTESGDLGLLILWDRPGESAPAKEPDPAHNEILTRDDCTRMLRSLLPMIGRRLELALQGAKHRAPWLSSREYRVLMLLAQGMSVPQIAAILCRSPYTIRDYVKNLHRKLGTTSRGTLIARTLGQTDIDIDTITHRDNTIPVFGSAYQTSIVPCADEEASAAKKSEKAKKAKKVNPSDACSASVVSANLRTIMLSRSHRWTSYLDMGKL